MKLFETIWPSNIPLKLPIVPTVDIVAFPQMIIPLLVVDQKIIAGIQNAFDSGKKFIIVVACKNSNNITAISESDLFTVGTVANIIRIINLQNGTAKILIQGVVRATITNVHVDEYFLATIEPLINNNNYCFEEVQEKINLIKNLSEELLAAGAINSDFINFLSKIQSPEKVIDYIVSHLNLSINDSQKLLESESYNNFFELILEFLLKENELYKLNQKVRNKAKESINHAQKEFYIREQIKALKEEIGDSTQEVIEYYDLLEKIKKFISAESYKDLLRNINRLESMSAESAEAGVLKNYLDCIFDLPWDKETIDNHDINKAKEILDKDHYGLDEAKERILDFLSVKLFSKNNFSTIICFHGPPGTGKTSLANSIANALNRKCFRMAVGGMRDESEIRGHRRTYVGAMPGRIIKGIKQVQSKNPLIIIDEIDKIGADFKGDPASALLELLDYQQNNSFYDYYLGIPFDLSQAFFITTANKIESIPHALRDRMELIEIPSYSLEEKYDIAKRFIIPRALETTKLNNNMLTITNESIKKIIENYTYEAGVRELDRVIRKVCSRAVRKLLEKEEDQRTDIVISEDNLESFLGIARFTRSKSSWDNKVGLSNGLCWTPHGGDVMNIESILLPGKGKLILTGQLGSVMKESAQIAFNYINVNSKKLNIKREIFLTNDIHIHFPAGAIPKDGPSAGFAIFMSLYSLFTNIPGCSDIAMTGEIDLNGNILPVGGIKEKVLAAQRNKLKKVLLPSNNKADFNEIAYCIDSLEVVFINTIEEGIKEFVLKEEESILTNITDTLQSSLDLILDETELNDFDEQVNF